MTEIFTTKAWFDFAHHRLRPRRFGGSFRPFPRSTAEEQDRGPSAEGRLSAAISLYHISGMILLLCFALVAFPVSEVHAASVSPEEMLAKINRLPPAERQANLVREAKNERTVVWYAPMNRE